MSLPEVAVVQSRVQAVQRQLTQLTADAVVSDQVNEIVQLTQAEYDALTPDSNTLYIIVG